MLKTVSKAEEMLKKKGELYCCFVPFDCGKWPMLFRPSKINSDIRAYHLRSGTLYGPGMIYIFRSMDDFVNRNIMAENLHKITL